MKSLVWMAGGILAIGSLLAGGTLLAKHYPQHRRWIKWITIGTTWLTSGICIRHGFEFRNFKSLPWSEASLQANAISEETGKMTLFTYGPG